jgi:hypothetical protein
LKGGDIEKRVPIGKMISNKWRRLKNEERKRCRNDGNAPYDEGVH